MEYTNEEMINCLEKRKAWYQKAIEMKMGMIPYENFFDFPDGNVENWKGALRELCNATDMLKDRWRWLLWKFMH